MFKFLRKNFCSNIPKLETDVCIIGGGSIGMTLSNLFSKYKINHLVLEKEKIKEDLCNHPKAHYISPRTVETFKYFDLFKKNSEKNDYDNNKNNTIQENIENIEKIENIENIESSSMDGFFGKSYFYNVNNWRHYRYCEFLLDDNSYLGEIDHLKPDVHQTLKAVNELSNAYPLHLGQNKLNEYLYDKLPDKSNFLFDHETQNFEFDDNEQKYTITSVKNNTNQKIQIKSKYIIGCDGSHSIVTKKLKIENKGTKGIQSFVNAHFTSKELAMKLKSLNKQSMLHFIFNPKFVCVLISYDLDKGEFVMQIPFFYKVEKESDYTKSECKRIIKELLSRDNNQKESIKIVNFNFFNFLNIEDVKFWRMKNVVIDKWFDNRCFIIGDAAHQFPPSGGYGLNTGVADAFSLAWRIKYLFKLDESKNSQLINSFEKERIIHSNFISRCAELNYNKFISACSTLNLNVNHCDLMQNVINKVLPGSVQRSVFSNLMNTGIFLSNALFKNNLKHHLKDPKNHINLIFPYLDYGLNYKYAEKNDINEYEKWQNFEENELQEGGIVQNYNMKNLKQGNLIRLRQYIKRKQEENEYPIFFVFINENFNIENIMIDDIKIFDEKIRLGEFKYEILKFGSFDFNSNTNTCTNDNITSKYDCKFLIHGLFNRNYKLVVIRPDFIVEKIMI